MTPKKAIEILDDCTKGALLGISEDTKDAFKLGIEALKRELDWRTRWPHQSHLPFPGETEEV